jgi:hypothetical protein
MNALADPCVRFMFPEDEGDTTGSAIFGLGSVGPSVSAAFTQYKPKRMSADPMILTSGSISNLTEAAVEGVQAQLEAIRSRDAVAQWYILFSNVKMAVAKVMGEESSPLHLCMNVKVPKECRAAPGILTWVEGKSSGVYKLFRWAKDWEDEVAQLEKLKQGWNGYDATEPTRQSIERAKSYLHAATREGFDPKRVEASVMGGVGITHRQGNRKVYVEFYNNGTAHGLFSDRTGRMHTMSVAVGEDELRRFIARAKDYLNGRDPT